MLRTLIEKIKNQINLLSLNFNGKVVLTEAATGYYIVTPFIAALAGAKVFAFSKDSKYGTASDVFEFNRNFIKNYDLNVDIQFIDKLDKSIIAQAEVITNSGHLRPLTSDILKYTKKGCVIPLMYEKWEWRKTDLDLNYCKKNSIPVGATNERHPDIDVFNYLGDMALKQILDSGICLYNNKFVLICNNDFGPYIAKVVSKLCLKLGVIDVEERKRLYSDNIDWLCNFPDISIPEEYKDSEAIIFTAYPFEKKWIGDLKTEIPVDLLIKEFKNPFVLRYAGDIDSKIFDEKKTQYFPEYVPSGHMGVLPSAIGFDPVIKLQSGGLKAGELMLNGNLNYKNIPIAELI